MKRKLDTARKLRENLQEQLEDFCAGEKTPEEIEKISAVSKVTATILRGAKLELQYAQYIGKNVEIPFLSQTETKEENGNQEPNK